ncbi:eCIS core domain-containing protein [Streptomyces javensis]|uniref:eCIS core domain-containing protein n=1 Tax=Streptomyces javensis TaxID=114698 RepID=A0ABP4HQ94_9ACTN
MSNAPSTTQDDRGSQSAKRRKRKERTGKTRTPEPKDIVSGAGQPLDPSVRRDLEEQLGHDLGQVRLHTDRDAGHLTELLGADAVAVGQDIFFRENTYRPGTTEGRRLLAHELLHTVQNPHGLGTLRAGRDLGAVSLPQQAVEREAEDTAQELVRGGQPETHVDPEQSATPGWLRYATVDADRNRMEKLDPATLVDRLANNIVRSLRGDPEDRSKRTRMQLARMAPGLRDSVLDRLEVRLLSSEHNQLLDLVEEADTLPLGLQPANVPAPVPDVLELVEEERAALHQTVAGERESKEKQEKDSREEKRDQADTRNKNPKTLQERRAADAADEKKEAKEDRARKDQRARQQNEFAQEQQQTEERQAEEREKSDQADEQKAQSRQDGVEQQKEERKEQREREEANPEQANAPGADKRKRTDDEKKPADGSKPEDVDPKAKGQPGPVRPEKVDERADQRDSALSEHGLNEKDEDEDEPREEERPLGLEAGADKDIGGGADDEKAGTGGTGGEPALKPEDYLPSTDLDVSSVPTADQITPGGAQPSLPTFPTPPPTKAEQVEEERENDAESEENEDEPEAETKPPGAEQGPVEGEAPQPEGGPAADAADRTERDLQPEQPVDQEVGPDPGTEDRQPPEPEAEEKKDPAQRQDEDKGGDENEDPGNGGEQPDAKEAQAEQQERKDRDEQTEKEESKGQPQGSAADKPAQAATAATPASASATPPAGAHTETTPTQDRTPSPAARRAADSAKGEREAPAPKSQVLKEQGSGAAPSGAVGGSEPAAAPAAAAGPGGAPSAAQAAVSPVGEQANDPGRMGAPAPEGAKATPEASLEKDGGGCAPPEPAPEQDGAGGSCGGGGGGQQTSQDKKKAPPDVSGQDPKTALNTVSQLPPDQAQAALRGVDGAADKKISQEQRRLDANPPTRERPSGAPQTQSAPPESQPAETAVTGKVEEVTPEDMAAKQRAKDVDKAAGEKPAQGTQAPSVTSSPDGKANAQDAKNIEQAADSVPTTDPALNRTVGPAPKIRLEGESDPKRTDKQAEKLKEKQADIQETGRADTSKNLGEDRIYPNAPRERLRGKAVGGSRAGGGGAGADTGQTPDEGVAVVTKQERGPQIQAGATAAHGQMVAKEKEQQQGEQQAKQQKQVEIDQEVARNAEQQTGERGRAAEEAQRQRGVWRKEQDQKLEDADKETEQEHRGKNEEITKEKDKHDKEIGHKKEEGNQQIDDERERAEKEAAKKKEEEKKKKEGGGGFLGWVKDQINNLIDAIVSVVTAVFDAARKVVNGIIEGFKTFVNKAIDLARDFAIKAIKALADVLIKIGDVLLAAFPELRDKFRKAIEGLRDKAIAAVNRLADGLKKAVNALLDALAAGLNKLLDALEAGLKAAIEVYRKALLSAIDFAQKALALLGQFAALAKDIAPDPGGWLSKAGSAAKTGISEYLWGAIKVAVKEWFNAKVEGILGLGKTIINVLVKGCVSLKQIGKMAWDAIVASLPVMIATIIIEKLVSMIIPAAGAILTIIQGLMAAWQTISRIIAAFGKFFAYLKAVKAGPAACLFAEAVAAGVVALLDFITNFLLARLGRAVKGVGNRLKAMAQKIMQGLKKTAKGARKAAGSAVNRARGAVRKADQALSKPATPTTPKGPRVPSRPGATTSPGGTRRPVPTRPTSRTPDRPPSLTPDRRKERNRNEAEAQRERDREKQTTPPKTQDRTPDKTPDTPRKKPKEVEAPKRTKPRKPRSPLGRALSRVKGAVKSALKKVRNAGKALGRKLRKSKVGKALKNSARRVRNFFKKKRNDWRRKHQQRKESQKQQRSDHKKKENSKEAKETRLQKIIERLRPKLQRLLSKGVSKGAFSASIAGLKAWYRLTSLDKIGSTAFKVLAKLNPQQQTVDGIDVDVADRLFLMLQRIGNAYKQEALATRRTDQNGNVIPPTPDTYKSDAASLAQQIGPNNMSQREERERYSVDSSMGLAGRSGIVQSIPAQATQNLASFVEWNSGGQTVASARRDQGPSYSGIPLREDQLVNWTSEDAGGTRRSRALSHNDFTAEISQPPWDRQRRSQLASGTLGQLADISPGGPLGQNSFELYQWFYEIEGGRDPAMFPVTLMGLDMAARGSGQLSLGHETLDYGDFLQFAKDFPMRPKKEGADQAAGKKGHPGAKKIYQALMKYMKRVQGVWDNPLTKAGRPRKRPQINTNSGIGEQQALMRQRQLRILRAWLGSLDDIEDWAKDLEKLSVEDETVLNEKLAQLERVIRLKLKEAVDRSRSTVS